MSTLLQIIQAIDEGRWQQALQWCDAQLQQQPQQPDYLFQKGIALSKAGRFAESLEVWNVLVDAHGNVAEYWEERALVWHKTGRNAAALADFEKAVQLEPDNPYRYACRAYIKDKLGDVAGAVADYLLVVEMDPADDVAQNNLELLQAKLAYLERQQQQFATPEHPTADEIAAYATTYQAAQPIVPETKGLTAGQQSVSPSAIIKEVAQVLVSKEGWKEFWAFARNGFKLPNR